MKPYDSLFSIFYVQCLPYTQYISCSAENRKTFQYKVFSKAELNWILQRKKEAVPGFIWLSYMDMVPMFHNTHIEYVIGNKENIVLG